MKQNLSLNKKPVHQWQWTGDWLALSDKLWFQQKQTLGKKQIMQNSYLQW